MFKEKLPVLKVRGLSCLKNYFQKVQDVVKCIKTPNSWHMQASYAINLHETHTVISVILPVSFKTL
jgi:hypothetical protein